MKKIYAIAVSLLMLVFFIPCVLSDTTVTVTGTFTATGTLQIEVNNTSPDFGTISVSSSQTVDLQVSNTGSVAANVVQDQAVKASGSMTLSTDGTADSQDEYVVEMLSSGTGASGSWENIGDTGTHVIVNSLAASSNQAYDLRVTIGPSLSAQQHSDEQFYANVTASSVS